MVRLRSCLVLVLVLVLVLGTRSISWQAFEDDDEAALAATNLLRVRAVPA